MTSTPQQRIGRYELIEFLGGGMSHVYRARDTTIGRIVALKILTPEGCNDVETRERFLQEVRMAGNIAHENILNIYDYGEADGRPFLVMEFLEGQDLRTLIRNQETGDTQSKLRIALQISRALEYIHGQNIIHRDIKPDNVRIMPNGVVKLMDFGIAKVQGLSRTQAGVVVGTPYYMAPEQVRGGDITTQVDLYAFGILLYELFAGVKPVKADDIVQIFHFILNEPLDLAPLRQAGAPEDVIQLIARCAAKDPASRPASFSVVVGEIGSMLKAPARRSTGETFAPTVPAEGSETRRTKAKWVIPAAVGVILLLVATAYFATKKRGVPPQQESAAAPPGMVLIPAGDFLSGQYRDREALPAFSIDRQEVSAGEYIRFANQTGRAVPEALRTADPLIPASDVSFDDASEYARWAGKRLPSFLEWERAARGTDGRKYPWGNEAGAGHARIDLPDAGPWPVTRQEDSSPVGALNMAGNVAEWVNQARTPRPENLLKFSGLTPPADSTERWFTVRGGSYRMPLQAAETWSYQSAPARFHSPDVGFRCAASLASNLR